jgi:hypothetical protein
MWMGLYNRKEAADLPATRFFALRLEPLSYLLEMGQYSAMKAGIQRQYSHTTVEVEEQQIKI